MTVIKVEFKGRDEILIEIPDSQGLDLAKARIKAIGCNQLLSLLRKYQVQFGLDLRLWPYPEVQGHAEMLLLEALKKMRGEWQYPYSHQELCHCRRVDLVLVDECILSGAQSVPEVCRLTGAGTACGTCQPEIEKIISYRLQKVF